MVLSAVYLYFYNLSYNNLKIQKFYNLRIGIKHIRHNSVWPNDLQVNGKQNIENILILFYGICSSCTHLFTIVYLCDINKFGR